MCRWPRVACTYREKTQLRVYHSVTPGTQARNFINVPSSRDQDFNELRMSRPELFARYGGGLIAVHPGDTEYPTFSTQGFDAFESNFVDEKSVILNRCRSCHCDSGIHSVQSRLRWIRHSDVKHRDIDTESRDNPMLWETKATIVLKQQDSSFRLLQRLWQHAGQ